MRASNEILIAYVAELMLRIGSVISPDEEKRARNIEWPSELPITLIVLAPWFTIDCLARFKYC